MKPTFILEALNLKTMYGWELNALSNNAEENFYNGILENSAICLSWVAIKKEISSDDLRVHHFKRNSADLPGIENSLPCFLIVTNGKKWFVSKTNDNAFSEIKLEGLIDLLANELNEIVDVLKTKNYDSKYIKKIKRSVIFMKIKINTFPNEPKKIKSKTDYINEIQKSTLNKDQESYSKELFFGKPETLSRLLEHKINEAYLLSQVLHRVLVKNYSPRQIETLLEVKNCLFIHVEIVQLHADLIFCTTVNDLPSITSRNNDEVIKYYKINTKGEISRYFSKSLEEKKELKKGLFSICKHTLFKLINKK